MRTLVILFLAIITWTACGRNETSPTEENTNYLPFNGEVTDLDVSQIPEPIRSEGKLLQAVAYEDLLGQHQLTIYQSGPLADERGEDAFMASLQLALYSNDSTQPSWAYSIAEGNCPFDLWVGIDTLTITDLDKNGIAELGIVLTHCCRSDVSPAQMQVLLHQNKETYRIAGNHWLSMLGAFPTPESYAMSSVEDSTAYEIEHDVPAGWGRFRIKEAPTELPGALREHARLLWRSQVVEKEFRSLSLDD